MVACWYILFVKTGKEYKVKHFIEEQNPQNLFQPFIPLLETFFKKSGIVKKETEILFPNYLFVESLLKPDEFVSEIKPLLYRNDDMIKVLRYDDENIALREEERQTLLLLCDSRNDYMVGASAGFEKGDKIYITEGPLAGKESIIKKADRHKMQAVIALDFMGTERMVSVALRIIERV